MGFPVKWPPFWVLRYTNYWKYLEIYIDIPFHFYDMLFVNVFVARSGWLWDEPVPRVLDDLGWQHDLGNLHRWYKFAFSDALLWHYCECIFLDLWCCVCRVRPKGWYLGATSQGLRRNGRWRRSGGVVQDRSSTRRTGVAATWATRASCCMIYIYIYDHLSKIVV